MTLLFIRPNPQKKRDGKIVGVYDPVKKNFMPENGAHVPANPYWAERLRQGDVVYVSKAEQTDNPRENLSSMTKDLLLAHAAKLGLTIDSRAKKADIIQAITAATNPTDNITPPKEEITGAQNTPVGHETQQPENNQDSTTGTDKQGGNK